MEMDRVRMQTRLVIRAFLLGIVVSLALVAFSVMLEPELKKYSLLVIWHDWYQISIF
jgi:hypothetical protein